MIKEEEYTLLLNDLLELHGYDFRGYADTSLKRRLLRLFVNDRFPSFAEFRYKLISDPEYWLRVVSEITVNVTEMFRDPSFYSALKQEVIPYLATQPFIRIWHAGCSTGEEVFSMAIILKEAGLLHKSLIYATDVNPYVIDKARTGIFPLKLMQKYSQNYLEYGGEHDFSEFYTAQYDHAKFNDDLMERMIFSTHNLVSDRSFNEFHLILCRNVFIYFEKDLQDKVFHLFDNSLQTLSYLALGSKETLKFSDISYKYKQMGMQKIWRKVTV